MTDRALAAGQDTSARLGVLAGVWLSLAVFLAVLALLATRMADGRDPAVLARAGATPPPARRVLIRRVLERRVIVHLPPATPLRPERAAQQLSAAGGALAFPPVTRTS